MFVEAHEGFYTSINTKTPIIKNLRKWLASSPQTDVTSSQIIDLKEIEDKCIKISIFIIKLFIIKIFYI